MKFIDNEGNLFGAVNVIDALFVLFVVAVIASGLAFLVGSGGQAEQPVDSGPETRQATVTMEVVGVQPYVANAITVGEVNASDVVAVENKSVAATNVIVQDKGGELHRREHPEKRTVTLRVSLNSTVKGDDLVYQEKPVEVGRAFTLDLGDTTAKGTVTELNSVR